MDEIILRKATIKDVPFLVDTIIEAEKSGTDKLSYSTIFGLTEMEVNKYIAAMLHEKIDGCEFSISSFLVVENKGQLIAAGSAWIEGINNIPSFKLKGNLLSYTLPKECIKRALAINSIVNEIHIDYILGSIQKGAGFISKEFRHKNIFGMLTNKMIDNLIKSYPEVSQVYTQVYGCNIPAIKANEKANFKIVMIKESANKEILQYLPSNKKILMKKELIKIKKD